MRSLINLVENPVPSILVIVHPGSACGSADFHLGRSQAGAERDGLVIEINGWQGGVIVVDGELSDELPRYGELNAAILGCLARAASKQLTSMRVFACDNLTADWPAKVKRTIARLKLPKETRFVVTGAWYCRDDTSGCVNTAYDIVASLGYPVEVGEWAVVDPECS